MNFAITLAGGEKCFYCVEGDSVLQGMMMRGQRLISVGCRGGGCGVCKVRILRGRYRTGVMSAECVNAEERAKGMALACKLFPESDLQIDVVGAIGRQSGRDASLNIFTSTIARAKNHFMEG